MSTTKFKMESGIQLLARLIKKPAIENFYPVLFESGPSSGDIIEISSDCNTSHLLVDIISESLLPNEMGGVEAGVLLFNSDGNFDYNNLIVNLKKKLKDRDLSLNGVNTKNSSELECLLRKALAIFFILEIYDATQLYTSIYNLENIVMKNSNITLVVFDTLTAFYWSEQSFKITRMDLYLKNLLLTIHKTTREYKVTCLFTRPFYFTSSKREENIDSSVLDLLNYRIHCTNNNDKNIYEINVRTNKNQFTKYFYILDNEVKWQQCKT